MRSGQVLAHLPSLLEALDVPSPYLPEMIAAKSSREHESLAALSGAPTRERIATDIGTLHSRLEEAQAATTLPQLPSAEPSLHNLLVRLRLGSAAANWDRSPG